jgi:predicted amidohydrolase
MPLPVALIREVFFSAGAEERLYERLKQARSAGAALAVLPEIPLCPWSPATPTARDDDAEEPGGRRASLMASAARAAGIGLVGGAIVRDPASGRRYNTALVFDGGGMPVAEYRKVHLPDEPGFHEPCHYAPGTTMARAFDGFGVRLGIQICSDLNRPAGCQILAADGAVAVLHPRATEAGTYERWKLVMRATAMTSCAYILSVNRPGPEAGVPLGGPTLAVDPTGEVIAESRDPVVIVPVDEQVVAEARTRYPGYLAVNAELYADGWRAVSGP